MVYGGVLRPRLLHNRGTRARRTHGGSDISVGLRGRLSREKQFAIISIATILGGGLSWNAIHQGRLMRAQELGLSAETLLMETGQEPLKLFIRSNMAIARRRAAPASTREAYEAM